MHNVTQSEIDALSEHDQRDRTRFWRVARYGNLECLSATFFTQRFPRHTHETYVIGVLLAGCNTYILRGGTVNALAGDVAIIPPGEVHDGGAADVGFIYRMTYPSVDLLREIAADVTGKPQIFAPSFDEPIYRDPDIFNLLRAAHERMESGGDGVAADELLIAAYGLLVLRHAKLGAPPRVGQEQTILERVRGYMDAHFCYEVDLAQLSQIAGLSRFHLIRAFRANLGMTPHEWLLDRRIRHACGLLAKGEPLAEVATDCGFFDQSHFTRAFKRRMGVTPGVFRAG